MSARLVSNVLPYESVSREIGFEALDARLRDVCENSEPGLSDTLLVLVSVLSVKAMQIVLRSGEQAHVLRRDGPGVGFRHEGDLGVLPVRFE